MRTTLKNELSGFTLLELVVAISIVGLLAWIALPRYAGITRDAQRVTVQNMAGSLSAAVAMVHGEWLVRRNAPSPLETVTVNADGWPIGEHGAQQITAAQCMKVWKDLLKGVPPTVAVGDIHSAVQSDYAVSVTQDTQSGSADCLYVYRQAPQHHIRYDTDRGEVTWM